MVSMCLRRGTLFRKNESWLFDSGTLIQGSVVLILATFLVTYIEQACHAPAIELGEEVVAFFVTGLGCFRCSLRADLTTALVSGSKKAFASCSKYSMWQIVFIDELFFYLGLSSAIWVSQSFAMIFMLRLRRSLMEMSN